MTEKEWDEEFSQKITNLTDEIWIGRYDLKGLQILENKIFKEIRKDRKHQQSEMLKRLPSVKEMSKILDEMRIDDEDPITSDFEENELEIAEAIHKLVKDKLKGK